MEKNDQSITLNTGAPMPVLGLGTWKAPFAEISAAVSFALTEGGYCHIDCAAIYSNEPAIGSALSQVFSSGRVRRDDVFITSKLWNTEHDPADVRRACEQTLRDLHLDVLDLYLMHWGIATTAEGSAQSNARGEPLDAQGVLQTMRVPLHATWAAMEGLVRAGFVRAIGVANFTPPMILDLLASAEIPPAVNQVEMHPYLQQSRLMDFCRSRGIVMTAYSPLGSPGNVRARGTGEPILIDDPVLRSIATHHHKTPVQILIRWAIERGTTVIPKSVTPERIRSNAEVFDFTLSADDMAKIAALEKKHRYVDPAQWWKIPYFD